VAGNSSKHTPHSTSAPLAAAEAEEEEEAAAAAAAAAARSAGSPERAGGKHADRRARACFVLEPLLVRAADVPLARAHEPGGVARVDLEHRDDAGDRVALLLANLRRGEAAERGARARRELHAGHGVAVAVVVVVAAAGVVGHVVRAVAPVLGVAHDGDARDLDGAPRRGAGAVPLA
jgi:hypothetical protein